MDLEKAVNTNLNGVNTLTKKVNELKLQLAALSNQLDSLPVADLDYKLENTAKMANINAKRIETIRSLDFETKLNQVKAEVQSVDYKLNKLLASIETNSKNIANQQEQITKLAEAINVNSRAIITNSQAIITNDAKIKDTLDSVEVVATEQIILGEMIDLVDKQSTDNNGVIDGCIVGVDRNNDNIVKVADAIKLLSVAVAENIDHLSNQQIAIAKNTESVEINSLQTKTNAINIRGK